MNAGNIQKQNSKTENSFFMNMYNFSFQQSICHKTLHKVF